MAGSRWLKITTWDTSLAGGERRCGSEFGCHRVGDLERTNVVSIQRSALRAEVGAMMV